MNVLPKHRSAIVTSLPTQYFPAVWLREASNALKPFGKN